MAWLYSKYSTLDGNASSCPEAKSYNICLTSLLEGANTKLAPKDRLFTKLVLEAPRITAEALGIITSYCHDEVFHVDVGGVGWSHASWTVREPLLPGFRKPSGSASQANNVCYSCRGIVPASTLDQSDCSVSSWKPDNSYLSVPITVTGDYILHQCVLSSYVVW